MTCWACCLSICIPLQNIVLLEPCISHVRILREKSEGKIGGLQKNCRSEKIWLRGLHHTIFVQRSGTWIQVPAASQTRQGRYFLVPANQLNYPLGMVCNILSCGPSSPKWHIVWGLVISNWQESLWKSCGFWSTVWMNYAWLIYHLKASWRIWPCSHHSWSGLFWPQALGVRHSQAKPGWVWYAHTKFACSSTCIYASLFVCMLHASMYACMYVCM